MASKPVMLERTRSVVADRLPPLRRTEWLFALYFSYVALSGGSHFALCLLLIGALFAMAWADSRSSGRFWAVVRYWAPVIGVLITYWAVDWVPHRPSDGSLEQVLIGWDRKLLDTAGLRAAIESSPAIPVVLDLAYLLLYAVPPLFIACFYFRRERRRLDEFLFSFLSGVLITCALLPHFPSQTPRAAFPGQDLPAVDTLLRRMTLWILSRGDIHASVFPSNHVTIAFSAALALLGAGPGYRRVAWILFALGVLILISTIYARYHYAADGLAGMAVSAIAFGLTAAIHALPARRRA